MLFYGKISEYFHAYQPSLTWVATLFAMLLLLALIRSRRKQLKKIHTSSYQFTDNDIEMLAGDDVITTQLDLARAYIEMGKNKLAKSILLQVKRNGKPEQKIEAGNLINSL